MKFNKETQLYTASATDIKKALAHLRKLNRSAKDSFYRCYFDKKNGDFSYPEFTGSGYLIAANCEEISESED